MKKNLRNSLSVACKVMKYSMMIMTVVCSLSSMLMANTVSAQKFENATVSLSADGKTISAILAEIETKTQFKFVYNPDHLKRDVIKGKIFKNEKVKLLLQKLGYTAREEGRSIIVTRLPGLQQPGKITGKVLDEKGEPLPGATIKVVETGQVIQANIDGTYQFNLSPGTYTLEVSYISFQTKRITGIVVLEGRSTLSDIAMVAATNELKQADHHGDDQRSK